MYRHPHSEFALGELAGFEFAYETGANVAEASFFITAGASAQFSARPLALGSFAADATSTAQFLGSRVIDAAFQIAGLSEFHAFSHLRHHTAFEVHGQAQSRWAAGHVARPEFVAHGQSTTEFHAHGSVGYRIEGTSHVHAPTEATAHLAFEMRGRSQFNALVEGYFETTMTVRSQATVKAIAQPFQMGAFDIAGESSMRAPSAVIHAAGTAIEGRASVSMDGKAIAQSGYAAAGKAQVTPRTTTVRFVPTQYAIASQADTHIETSSRRLAHSGFDVAGASDVAMRGQGLQLTTTQTHGYATVSWVRGPQILPRIDPAEYQTERPEELRGVERPEENRSAEYVT